MTTTRWDHGAGLRQDGTKSGDQDITSDDMKGEHGAMKEQEEMELICRVCDPLDEDLDDEAEEEAEPQRPFRDPGVPTKREIAEHNLTHIPPRPWCPH